MPNIRHTYAYIPTVPSNGSNYAYINITNLINTGSTYFTPPQDEEWLKRYKWFRYSRSPEDSYFVKSFELFIPGLKCKNETDVLEIMVKVVSSESTQLFINDKANTYLVPSATYRFEYHGEVLGCNNENVSSILVVLI